MAWTFEHADRHAVQAAALGLGKDANAFGRRHVQIDQPFRIARPDGQLVHVDIRCVQHRMTRPHRNDRQRVRHCLGGQRGAFQRIQRDVHLDALARPDFLADEQHRRLVALALADNDGPIDRQAVDAMRQELNRLPIDGTVVIGGRLSSWRMASTAA